MTDLTLVFLPQWSPFQPPLSLPSLAAWLRRAGYAVRCVDANVLFYQWLLSDECAECALELLETCRQAAEEKEALRVIFESRADFRRDLAALQNMMPVAVEEKPQIVSTHYAAIRSLDTYLCALSTVSEKFVVSPYDFRLKAGNDSASLASFVADPTPLISGFLQKVVMPVLAEDPSPIVGLSCIGEEQLFFALLFGSWIKRSTASQVIVGGTIFSRIFERGILNLQWMRDYFDVVVRNEGEKPCEAMLRNVASGVPLTEGVPGVVYLAGDALRATNPAPPLRPEEVPVPDFDGLPLRDYISAEITLPLLGSRGCYWGKCEFCHHYMVYGDKYTAYPTSDIVGTLQYLSAKYGCKRFAFNDEAVPPKVIAALGRQLPDHRESGFTFTGLIKFERYFTAEHFANLARVGFRSLYVGLESASERVLALMKKPNTIETIARNLRDAANAGIWMHCFAFFGFPGETEEDAQTTFDFLIGNSDIVGSFGCGEFSLEHNAPIQKHLVDFGVTLSGGSSDVSVYYKYSVTRGITALRALEWSKALRRDAMMNRKYRTTQWIPREFLLCLISHFSSQELIEECDALESRRGVPQLKMREIVTMADTRAGTAGLIVNRLTGTVARIEGQTFQSVSYLLSNNVASWDVLSASARLDEFLAVGAFAFEDELVPVPITDPKPTDCVAR
jgi:anaerobic magnesium-protoporphyrin IX monomethyl ester cyclase